MSEALDAPVIAFRVWRLRGHKLHAIAFPTEWPADARPADCLEDGAHPAPEGGCSCGWYALHEPPYNRTPGTVLGAVLAWGRLEVHPAGLRAERATPIVLVDDGRPALQRVARRYGATLCAEEHLEVVAAEHGAPVPRSLRAMTDGDLITFVGRALRRRERGLRLSATQRDVLDRAGGLAATTPATSLPDVLRAAWHEAPAETVPWGEARAALAALLPLVLTGHPWRWLELAPPLLVDRRPLLRKMLDTGPRGRMALHWCTVDDALAADEQLRQVAREARRYARGARRALMPRGISTRAHEVVTVALRDELPDEEVVERLLTMPLDQVGAVLRASPGRRRAWAHGLAAHGVVADARSLREDLSPRARRRLREGLDHSIALLHAERRNGRLVHLVDSPPVDGPRLHDLVDAGVRSGLLRPAEATGLADDLLRSTLVRAPGDGLVRQWLLEGPLGACASPAVVRRLLHAARVPDGQKVLALGAHPDADREVARRLWEQADLDAAGAFAVLRATGSLAPELARGARDVPRRIAAVALGHLHLTPTEDDPLLLQRVAAAVREGAAVDRALLSGAWMER